MSVLPGADVMEIARSCYWGIPRQDGSVIHPNDERHPIFCVGAIARALQQYGDERAREARKAAPHVGAEEHVVRKLREAAAEWRAAGNESALSIFNSVAMCHMVDAANEAAREATEAERRRCATIDHIDIDLIRREARAAAIEEVAKIAAAVADEEIPEPYWDNARARRMDWASCAGRILGRVRALAAKPGSET